MHLLEGTPAYHAALRPPAIVGANINMPTCLRLPRSHRFARSTADDVELTFNLKMLYHCNYVCLLLLAVHCYDDTYNSHHNAVLLRSSALGHY